MNTKKYTQRILVAFFQISSCIMLGQNFSNSGGTNDFYSPSNWDIGTFPTISQNAVINKTGDDRAIINTYNEANPKSVRVGYGGSGTLEIQDNGYLNVTSTSGTVYVGNSTGNVGLVEQNGGTVLIGAGIYIGNNGGSGTWNLNNGLLKSTRGEVILGGTGKGVLRISDGEFQTRTGVSINNGGNFMVIGSKAHSIGLGKNGTIDGFWKQASGGIASFFVDQWGTTPIHVYYVDGANGLGGDVTFNSGSKLDVGFANGTSPLSGTWTVLEWDGIATDNGLSFASTVDTSIWSFAIVGKTLQITANVANTTTTNKVPYTWYNTYFPGLSSDSDYENLDNVDSDSDGLTNKKEFLAKTNPKDNGQITTIEDLIKYSACDNVKIKMTPSEYTVTKNDMVNNVYEMYPDKYINYAMLSFRGNNSTYDLTGVKINFSAFHYYFQGNNGGTSGINAIHIIGDKNSIKGLTWEENDDNYGMLQAAVSILVDGDYNLLESITLTTRGSYPYGYGSDFGIGADYTIAHKKHSGLLVSGDNNTIFKCNLYAKTFGHGFFVQGADYTTFRECYIEGVMRTTDDMLKETSGPAYAIGFMTTNGTKLQPGKMSSLSEDGIRAYADGRYYDTGLTKTRTTSVKVYDCTIKNMRRGVHTNFTDGGNIISGVTVIGVQESGFVPAANDVISNCIADAVYAPILNMYYDNMKNINANISVIPRTEAEFYGNEIISYNTGSNNTITINDYDPCFTKEKFGTIYISGVANVYSQSASNLKLTNNTKYPIYVGANSTGAILYTPSTVTNDGTSTTVNTIAYTAKCCTNTTAKTEGECHSSMSGITTETNSAGAEVIANIHKNDWAVYNSLDLTGMKSITAAVSSNNAGGTIEVRLGSITGTLIGTLSVANTGSWQTYTNVSANIVETTGVQNVYLVFNGGNSYLFNIDYFGFSPTIVPLSNPEMDYSIITIYPNPSSNKFYIHFNETLPTTVEIYNSLGQLILSKKTNGNPFEIDLETRTSGLYIAKIKNENHTIIKQLIKL